MAPMRPKAEHRPTPVDLKEQKARVKLLHQPLLRSHLILVGNEEAVIIQRTLRHPPPVKRAVKWVI